MGSPAIRAIPGVEEPTMRHFDSYDDSYFTTTTSLNGVVVILRAGTEDLLTAQMYVMGLDGDVYLDTPDWGGYTHSEWAGIVRGGKYYPAMMEKIPDNDDVYEWAMTRRGPAPVGAPTLRLRTAARYAQTPVRNGGWVSRSSIKERARKAARRVAKRVAAWEVEVA